MSDQSPLSTSFDTTQVKTGKPILIDGWEGKVRFVSCGERKGDKGDSISFEFHLLQIAPTSEGKQVNPGFPLFDAIYLYDKNTPPGQIPERSIEKMCKIQDAFLGTGDPDEPGQPAGTINKKGKPVRPAFGPECVALLIGKEAWVKTKQKSGEYEGNEIVKYRSLSDMQP